MNARCRVKGCSDEYGGRLCSKYLMEDILHKLWSARSVSHLFNKEENRIITDCPKFEDESHKYKINHMNEICFRFNIPLKDKWKVLGVDEPAEEVIDCLEYGVDI
jgi:hypothetical protein